MISVQPLISVIVPIYNAEAYLHKCIDGILTQTLSDFQLILVDDGSTDKSPQICDDYAHRDSRVEAVHKENGGLTSARKVGMDFARGGYSIHIDPDDWVEPNLLEALYCQAQAQNADMVICDFWEHANGAVIYSKQQPRSLHHKDVMAEMFTTLKGTMWNKLIRTSCYRQFQVQFYEELVLIEDLFLNFQLLLHPMTVAYVPQALYHYERNVNPNSLTMTGDERFQGYADGICRRFRELLQPYPEFWNLWVEKEMPWIAYLTLYYGAFDSKRFQEEFSYLKHRDCSMYVKIALKNYAMGRAMIIMRKKLRGIKLGMKKILYTVPVKQINVFTRLKLHIHAQWCRLNRLLYKGHLSKNFTAQTSIICNNCFGSRISQDLHLQYMSPTVGLFIPWPDFFLFTKQLQVAIQQEISFRPVSKYDGKERNYPIGVIAMGDDDIEIHFLHYQSAVLAKTKWEHRCRRVNFDNVIYIYEGSETVRKDQAEEFLSRDNCYFFNDADLGIRHPHYHFVPEMRSKSFTDGYDMAHLFYKYF